MKAGKSHLIRSDYDVKRVSYFYLVWFGIKSFSLHAQN